MRTVLTFAAGLCCGLGWTVAAQPPAPAPVHGEHYTVDTWTRFVSFRPTTPADVRLMVTDANGRAWTFTIGDIRTKKVCGEPIPMEKR